MSNQAPSVETILMHAVEIDSPTERQAYVEAACAGDVRLKKQVEQLIANHFRAGSFLQAPAAPPLATIDDPIQESPGTIIGPYKLLEQIGEGGFGVVFMAEQTEPIRRKVALKVLKPGMDTRQVVARFEAERQALALMDHPNIAQIHDGGTTPDGRPFFVMELVKGVPITDYCDRCSLTTRERLELFLSVCQAVQHAHQKGIIHRDIKPSNVLVAIQDGKPTVKVIDFGVAKAINQRLSDNTVLTGFHQMIGTPLYMSPEQAEMSPLDVDTRADIYSLGVLLYELLTGTTPFEKERLSKATYDEMRRIIREEEPPRPSARLSTLQDKATDVATQRRTNPRRLKRSVQGELDWIVMKALEKDRNRRYETANSFGADVERYLNDKPVEACPPNAWYRLRKYGRKHRVALLVASVMLLAMLVAVGGVAGGIGWAVRDREAREAQASAQIGLILDDVDRLEKQEKWPEAWAVVKRAEPLMKNGQLDPATQRRAQQALADLELVHRLEEIRMLAGQFVDNKLDYADAIRAYVKAFRQEGIDLETMSVDEAAKRLQARAAIVMPLTITLDDWAYCCRENKDKAGEKALLALSSKLDRDPWRKRIRASIIAGNRITIDSVDMKKFLEQPRTTFVVLICRASRESKQVISLLEKACWRYPGDFWLHFWLARQCQEADRAEDAIRHYVAALAIRPRNSSTMNNLGNVYSAQKELDKAIASYRRAIQLDSKNALAHNNLGNSYKARGDLDNAMASYKRAIQLDPNCALAYNNLGVAYTTRKQLDKAIACLQQAIQINPNFAQFHLNLGLGYHAQKELDKAIASYRRAIQLDSSCASAQIALGGVYHDQKELDKAITCYRKAIQLSPQNALAHNNLGGVYIQQGELDEAIQCYKRVIELDPKDARPHIILGVDYAQKNELNKAVDCFLKAIKIDCKNPTAHQNLGRTFLMMKKYDQAMSCYRKVLKLQPNNHVALGNLALHLIQADDPKQRDPQKAVIFARRALEINPNNAYTWRILSLSCYRTGRWQEALEARKKVMSLVKREWPNDCFWRSMIHWQLGKKGVAREWFDKAEKGYKRMRSHPQGLTAIRREAMELLGTPGDDTMSPKSVNKKKDKQ